VTQASCDDNPLLSPGLPRFSDVRPEHALPAIETRLSEYRDLLARIASATEAPDYDSVVAAESLADNALATAWSTVSHLHGVNNTPAWREAYEACLEPITRFYTERGHDRGLFDAYRQLAERPDLAEQPDAVRAIVEHEIRDFRLSGVDLPEARRRRFADIDLRLSELSNRFGNQVLDATEAYTEHFTDRDALAGLPDSELEILATLARQAERPGWLANLSHPAYRAIITYADDRALRERFYTAFVSRASDAGPNGGQHDNSPLVAETLALRDEQARLLGFEHYASMGLATRMADSAEAVDAFLRDLARRARPQAEAELERLTAFAAGLGAATPLEPWDVAYYAEKQRDHELGINQEKLKPWFELHRCFDGLFLVAGELFGMTFEADRSVDTWHEDVLFFRVLDGNNETVAGLYIDLYSRPRKSGGAWMDVCRSRLAIGSHRQQPIAYLTCNFAPPSKGRPSLLTHDDLVTLFHEFGHCLHHLLTRIDLPPVGGISGVEWDAVELPSQLLEGWAWEERALARFARHVETDKPLSADLVAGLKADRRFHGAMALLRQIEFALTDLTLHRQAGADPIEIMRRVHDEIAVMPMPDYNRYLMSFSHLFAGGYAAGYYSYLWAERLARDAFELFSERGLFDRRTGRHLAREILEVGACRPMAESWQAFRGRGPDLAPLLAAYGVGAPAPANQSRV
jgi:oligopeptidase A